MASLRQQHTVPTATGAHNDHKKHGVSTYPGGQSNKQKSQEKHGVFSAPKGGLQATSPSNNTGGGSHRAINQEFQVNPSNGTLSLTLPFPATPGRRNFTPNVNLTYDSGLGNGIFGVGWDLPLGKITRKTSKRIPLYDESDVFVLSGADDLVPVEGKCDKRIEGYSVDEYKCRVESEVQRIERWKNLKDEGDVYWRVTTGENVTTFYGQGDDSRIYDIDVHGRKRILSWLVSGSIDAYGNAINYVYKPEDSERLHDRNRSEDGAAHATAFTYAEDRSTPQRMKHIKAIQYGNSVPGRDLTSWAIKSLAQLDYMFSIVIDYGDHETDSPSTSEQSTWYYRQDPFSIYNSGFELRTCRLVQRILMFHHIPEKLMRKDYLVTSLEFKYTEKRTGSFLASATLCGHIAQKNGGYQTQRCAPHSFQYSHTPSLTDLVPRQLEGPNFSGFPSLSQFRTEWVDLDSEGSSGRLILGDKAWYYQRNNMALDSVDHAPFGPLVSLEKIPNLQSEAPFYFDDLERHGVLDIVNADEYGRMEGFMEREDNGWSNYKTFKTLTNNNSGSPEMETQRIDLTGSGLHDILWKINDSDTVTWQQSFGKEGLSEPQRVKHATRLPDMNPKDPNTALYFCDMSGDGLVDLVQISNGRISYWPNIGYGSFGKEILMNNSPFFDGDSFNISRVKLGDIDGSGTTDLIYLPASGGAHVYFNEAGNSWSSRNTINAFPSLDSTSSVFLLDLLGNGTSCLCWSGPGTTEPNSLLYLDLMKGVKPNLLVGYSNGIGLSTMVEYKPSTWFYMNDLYSGSPWLTKLSFPVHCISRVEHSDRVASTRITTRYAYHDGYYDKFEREFRGFALTESWDAEDYCTTGYQSGDVVFDRPPVHTKTWWHTGATDIDYTLSSAFSPPQLGSCTLPQNLQAPEYAQVARALKGKRLRTEIFSDDLTAKSQLPYEVVEHSYKVVRIQSPVSLKSAYGVYRVDSGEAISSYYERDLQDPRQEHKMYLEVNEYGQETKSITITYGIPTSKIPDPEAKKQQEDTIILYDETTYTNAVVEHPDFRLPQVNTKRQFRILNAGSSRLVLLNQKDFFPGGRLDLSTMPEIPIGVATSLISKNPNKVLLADTRTRYLCNALSGPLSFGLLDPFSVLDKTFTLAMTSEMYKDAYGDKDFLKDCCIKDVRESGGYASLGEDGKWWKASEQSLYADPGTGQLPHARSSFYSSCVTVDPFGNKSWTTLDEFFMMPLCKRDALGNETSFSNNYRVFQPWQVTDINGNRSQTSFDAFGNASATAILGKEDEAIGDSLEGLPDIFSQQVLNNFMKDPTSYASRLLSNAGKVILRDRSTFQQTMLKPTWQATIQRDAHFRDGTPQIMVSIEYYDAQGKPLQEVVLREKADTTTSWIVSGWEVRDNKGTAVRKFQPSISGSHEFIPQVNNTSPCTTFILDPLERLVGILHSDHTWEKVEQDSWSKVLYDAGDTINSEPWSDPIVSALFRKGGIEKVTWQSIKTSSISNRWDIASADKSLLYHNTPKVCYYDASGRIILDVSDKNSKSISTGYIYDLLGNKSKTTDGLSRIVDEIYFDYLGRPLRTANMDSGYRWSIFDCDGKPILEWNSKGFRKALIHDALRRPTETWISENRQPEVLVTKVLYGEAIGSITEPKRLNQRGEIVEIYDQAGVLSNMEYDFKGNCISTSRRFAKEYKSTVDWSKPDIPLEDGSHISLSKFDALGRNTEFTDTSGAMTRRCFNLNGCLSTVEWKAVSQPDWQTYIGMISYSADLQPIRIDYGNGVHTVHSYDDQTRRVVATKMWTDSRKVLKDARYTYDCLGNATHIEDRAQPTEYFDGSVVGSSKDYTYDSIGQLIRAEGRERFDVSNGGKNTFRSYQGSQTFERSPLPGNGKSMGRYIESYDYDLAGNIRLMKHEAGDGAVISGWTREYFYKEPSIIEPGKECNRLSYCQISEKEDRYEYDPQGCITSMPGCLAMTWDYDNKLKSSSTQKVTTGTPEATYYRYDYAGKRVRKVIDNFASTVGDVRKQKEVIYSDNCDILISYKGDGQTQKSQKITCHIVGNNAIALVEDSLVRYQMGGGLELDDAGNIVSYEEYSPYGSTTFMACGKNITAPRKYRFASYERDYETGLYFCNARYYAAWLGRWMSPDPLGTLDSNNLYQYCANDPVNFDDPNGTDGGPKDVPGENAPIENSTTLFRPMSATEAYLKDTDTLPSSENTSEQPKYTAPIIFNNSQQSLASSILSLRPGEAFKSAMDKGSKIAQDHKQDIPNLVKSTQEMASGAYNYLDIDQYYRGTRRVNEDDFGWELASGLMGGMLMGTSITGYTLYKSAQAGKVTWPTGARSNRMSPSNPFGISEPFGSLLDKFTGKWSGRNYIEKNILNEPYRGPTRALAAMGAYGILGYATGVIAQKAMLQAGIINKETPGILGFAAAGFGKGIGKY
ncbi:hypothetical protein ABW19_dt0208927 [Dactylella cylindrospora]|nr:hypothetical protein ABW19_dt0208927 [Dactylella cylindrospora]